MVPVILVIIAFNFFGDGLRDAADLTTESRYRRDHCSEGRIGEFGPFVFAGYQL